MLDKFNFYDLLGYLLPGATVVLTLYWFSRSALGVPVPELGSDFGSSVIFLGLSYIVGHLVHDIGSIYENRLNRAYDGLRLGERLLLPAGHMSAGRIRKPFSTELKERIFASAQKVFGVATQPAEVFEQCYAAVVQQGLAQHTEIFLALTGLARSMLVAASLGLLLSLIVVEKQAMLTSLNLIGLTLPQTPIWRVSQQQCLWASAGIASSVLTVVLMHRAFEHFREFFSQSVYYNFLAWYGREQLSPPPKANE